MMMVDDDDGDGDVNDDEVPGSTWYHLLSPGRTLRGIFYLVSARTHTCTSTRYQVHVCVLVSGIFGIR